MGRRKKYLHSQVLKCNRGGGCENRDIILSAYVFASFFEFASAFEVALSNIVIKIIIKIVNESHILNYSTILHENQFS